MADILVVIVTWNGMEWISRCIDSVVGSDMRADIFVVDNGSTDGTVEWLLDKDIHLEVLKDNPGFGAANNVGMEYALKKGYRYVYLLNQDAWVSKDTFRKLVDSLKDGRYGVVSPIQTDAGGSRMDANFKRHCGKAIRKAPKSQSPVEVPFVMAAHWMMTAECIRRVGGFSPAFRQYGEDDNYLHRLRWHGYRCGVVPGAKAVHDRRSRTVSKEQKMRLKCISTVVKVSDPNASLAWRMVREPLELLGMSLIRWSKMPLKFIPTLIGRYPELIRLRRASRKEGAFLDF